MTASPVAVEGADAVVRVEVNYGPPTPRSTATCGCCTSRPTAGSTTSRSGPTGRGSPTPQRWTRAASPSPGRARRSTAPAPSANTGWSGSARANRVIDERSFIASMPPKICSAVVPWCDGDDLGALDQPRPEHRVGQVGPGLGQVGDRVRLGHRAAAQPGDLREDEPHPVAGLAPAAKLGDGLGVGLVLVLGPDEALEIHARDLSADASRIDWLSMTTPPPDEPPPDPARWRSLAICLVASAMTLLDLSIVNVALPSLRASLGADDSDLQWIVAGYALAFGVVLVPAGRLGDARSRRTIFMLGVALFTLSSAVAGAAPNPTVLAVARVVQGLAGGLIAPQTSGFIQNLFRGPERARAFGLLGAAIGVEHRDRPAAGRAAGQPGRTRLRLAAGLLRQRADRHRPAAAGLSAAAAVPSRPGERQSLDPVGVGLFAAAVLLVLLPLVEGGQDQPLTDRPWWLAIPAVVLLAGCLLWERCWSAPRPGDPDRPAAAQGALLRLRPQPGHVLLRRLHRDLPGGHPLPAGRAGLQRAGGRRHPDPVRRRLGDRGDPGQPLGRSGSAGCWSCSG